VFSMRKELGFYICIRLMPVFQGLIVSTIRISNPHKNRIFAKLLTNSTACTQSNAYCEFCLTLRIQGFD
jgi:cell division protein FtsW (lipid II flippase)